MATIPRLRWKSPLTVVLITLLASLLSMGLYVRNTLNGNFDEHLMPGQSFGIPKRIQAKGFKELYTIPGEAGWDGQFYFFMANDLLGTLDTAQHIDNPTYRYQRIGLPLLSNLLAEATLQDWVSPKTYYLTSLLLILLATYLGAAFLRRSGYSPFWILFWSLGIGTQITMLNGLPDAAADALLIIALIAILEKSYFKYSLAIALAALTREVYVIFPGIMIASAMLVEILDKSGKGLPDKVKMALRRPELRFSILPVGIALLWQMYVRVHFAMGISLKNGELLGFPLKTILSLLADSIRQHHPLSEGWGLGFFIGLIAISIFSLMGALQFAWKKRAVPILAFAIGFLILCLLYLCFGPTVAELYSGYMKAANIFYFVIPFVAAVTLARFDKRIAVFLVLASLFFTGLLITDRLAPNDSGFQQYTQWQGPNTIETASRCIANPRAQVELESIAPLAQKGFRKIFSREAVLASVKITNTSSAPFRSFGGKGGVNLSAQWFKSDGKTPIGKDIRLPLTAAILPGQKILVPVALPVPGGSGNYLLRITPVQENCTFFDAISPSNDLNVKYSI